jgi:hypothetical protein
MVFFYKFVKGLFIQKHALSEKFGHACSVTLKSCNFGFPCILGQIHTQNFETCTRVGYILNRADRKVFWDLAVKASKSGFHGLKMVLSYSSGLIYQICSQIHPRLEFFEQNLKLKILETVLK